MKAIRNSMMNRGSSPESYIDAYSKMLGQISTKKGSPSAREIHEMIGQNIKGKDKNMLLGGIPTDAIRMN